MKWSKFLGIIGLATLITMYQSIEAGIYGYQRLYHPKVGTCIDLVFDAHLPYNNPKKKINNWEEQFHPGDRKFFNIIKELDEKSSCTIDVYWEGYPGCEIKDPRAPFIIKSGARLSKELNAKVTFNYSDNDRPTFAKALHNFLDVAISGIDKEFKNLKSDLCYTSEYNPITYISSMSRQGFNNELSKSPVSVFLKDFKATIFKEIDKKQEQKIHKKYGSNVLKELKDYYQDNRTFWRNYYKKNVSRFENKSVKYFIDGGGVQSLVNLPYNSEICRSHVPFNNIPKKMFDNYQEIFDLEALFNMLASDKKRIIFYAGGAHCENMAQVLQSLGFQAKKQRHASKHRSFGFINPKQLEFLYSC